MLTEFDLIYFINTLPEKKRQIVYKSAAIERERAIQKGKHKRKKKKREKKKGREIDCQKFGVRTKQINRRASLLQRTAPERDEDAGKFHEQ